MAVRVFDLTEPQSSKLTVVEATPSRRDRRRQRRRYALIGAVSLAIPFFGALILLEVAH